VRGASELIATARALLRGARITCAKSTHPRDARRAARWRHAVAALLLIVAGPACAESNAAGSFETRVQKLDLTGAYAWWTRLPGGSARGLRVAVSNAEFKPDLLDHGRTAAPSSASSSSTSRLKVVYFDFDADGRYRGYAYDFGGGDACDPCTDAGVRSTVRTAGGRIKGKVAAPGSASTAAFDVNFDVRVPERTWGTPLPADGGEPGRAYFAYHQALATGDIPALKNGVGHARPRDDRALRAAERGARIRQLPLGRTPPAHDDRHDRRRLREGRSRRRPVRRQQRRGARAARRGGAAARRRRLARRRRAGAGRRARILTPPVAFPAF
jgi:hypothetical protein